jgi:hypothetical protein
VAEREFQQHRERTARGRYQTVRLTAAAGTWVVPTNQPLGRLAFMLLEPRSDDGALTWNVLDRALGSDWEYWPVLRVRQGTALSP